MKKTDLIVILGATATGKTNLATRLAYELNGEIISADSRQVYKGMDVGTGKDLTEFIINNTKIPYHLIDIINAGEDYNVFNYQKDFLIAFNEIKAKKKQPILCGGTGMYIEAVLKGYKLIEIPKNEQLRSELSKKTTEELVAILATLKSLHNSTDSIETERIVRAIEIAIFEKKNQQLINDYPKIKAKLFGIHYDRETLKQRITTRLKHRLKHDGMIEEVESLIAIGVNPEKLKFYGLEYKLITQFLLGEIDRKTMFSQLNIAIHQFSKRQATWFRKMERNGFEINWIDGNLPLDKKIAFIQQHN
jgi:tRNA dimethylallyltransferase